MRIPATLRRRTRPAPRRALPRVPTTRRRFLVIGVAIATVVGGLIAPGTMLIARAATTTIVVNNTAYGGPAANPSSGVCETATGNGQCTLRAAIEVSNALKGQPGDVLITVSQAIQLNTKMTGSMNNTSNYMLTSSINGQDAGAQYVVSAPVTIDLGHRLQPDSSTDDTDEAAMFYLTGSDIQILNADNVLSAGSSFVVGANASNITINGDTMGTNGGYGQNFATAGWGPERFVMIMQGAQNVTVTNYQVSGYYDSELDGGIFLFVNPTAGVPARATQNVVIDNVQALYTTGSTCSGSNGSGCRTRLTSFWQGSQRGNNGSGTSGSFANNVIVGLTFRNMVVQNMAGQWGFLFAESNTSASANSADITNLTIENNRFINNQSHGTAPEQGFMMLPYANYLRGTTSISNNVFTSNQTSGAQTGGRTAIFFLGAEAANSTRATNVTIADNYFNGYGNSGAVRASATGLVSVTGNTFGTSTIANASSTEETGDTGVMFSNSPTTTPLRSANQAILTWAPTTGNATVLGGPMPAGALTLQPPAPPTLPTCTATVTVTKPTAVVGNTTLPTDPVTLGVYWTGTRTAEVYLGKVTGVVGPNATLALALPVGTVTLPDGKTVTPVDPTTGAPSGFIRVQTQAESLAQLESSQYSRAVPVTGSCRPALTVEQAPGMTDPTVARDLHFTFTSSVPLDLATVSLATFNVTATAVPQTSDASRLNPQVMSVTPIAGSGDTVWDVVVHVDDSATVKVTVGAGAVACPNGLTNAGPSTSVDNAITFLNPIRVVPGSFTLVTGEPEGKDFTIELAPGAPVPEEALAFSATVNQPNGTPKVTLSTDYPVLDAGDTSTAPITAVAAPGTVMANTPVLITMTVASADANYNGLVVPSATAYLFSTDPTIQIVKSAYVNVGDPSTAATIAATGTLAPRDSRLTDGQAVCFVYTVTNTSADDWATSLTNIQVTDSDTRLGKNGVIGTVASLGVGLSTQLAACTTIIPVDTTVESP